MQLIIRCPRCEGTGRVPYLGGGGGMTACRLCHGSAEVTAFADDSITDPPEPVEDVTVYDDRGRVAYRGPVPEGSPNRVIRRVPGSAKS
jgi:DnaJ-class molecular chaperone